MKERSNALLLLMGVAGMCWVGWAPPAAAQAPADAWLERLQAELALAAETTASRAAAPRVELRGANTASPESPVPAANAAPPWQRRLPADKWQELRAALEAEGVPAEFLSVGWVESRFDPLAQSPKGARGFWQLMPATARRYGLTVSAQRDDRIALGPSTRAAAQHLADLHRQFSDWLLALAAYNAGAERVESAIARAGSRDFWQVRPWLPAETQNYVPAVLAAMGSRPAALADREANSRPASPVAGQVLFATTTPPDTASTSGQNPR